MSKMTKTDYNNIVKYYEKGKVAIKRTPSEIKKKAEQLLATKMCRCIKSVSKSNNPSGLAEQKAIAICRESVINRKNLNIFGFTCKKGAKLKGHKGNKTIKIVKR